MINLALFLAGTRDPVTAAQCRSAGLGYPEGQDALAFDRMFERDKDTLRAAGLPIEVDRRGEVEAYRLDASAYAAPITLSAEEVAALSAVAAAARHDPSFPLAGDLSYALAKLGHAESTDPVAGRLADEAPEQQGETAAELAAAISARKRARFGYTNVAGTGGTREVEPYALFLREGRWYLVGRDIERGELRTYTLARMTDLAVNGEQPKTPDFEREPGFDAASFVLLPFQYGPLRGEVTLRFAPELAWRAERLTAGQGTLKAAEDGSITWRVPVADEQRLLRWIVENGPGILPLDARLRDLLAAGLRRVVTAHGG